MQQLRSLIGSLELKNDCLNTENTGLKQKIALLDHANIYNKDQFVDFEARVLENNKNITLNNENFENTKKGLEDQLKKKCYILKQFEIGEYIKVNGLKHTLDLDMKVLCSNLLTCKDAEIANSIYQTQSEHIQSTLRNLGWWQSNLGPEARVGILFDAARIHNNRDLIIVAEKIILRYIRKLTGPELKDKFQNNTLNIPMRSILMANSLRADLDCADMCNTRIANYLKLGDITRNNYAKLLDKTREVSTIEVPNITDFDGLYKAKMERMKERLKSDEPNSPAKITITDECEIVEWISNTGKKVPVVEDW